MDIFNIHDVKSEKENAMLQYRRFRNIAKLFRLVELFLAVVLLSWISTRLPFVIRILNEYFRQFLSVIVSPLFIFLVGNVIVLTLVVKSGQLTGNFSIVDITGSDLYEEIVNNVSDDVPPVLEPEEIVYQDKQIISEVNTKPISGYCCDENEIKVSQAATKPNQPSADSVPVPIPDLDLKTYRRSQSDYLMKRECVVELRRSETEIGRQKNDAPVEEKTVVDELSNEEFQRRIEGFIARQVRFHQEEKLSIVPHNIM